MLGKISAESPHTTSTESLASSDDSRNTSPCSATPTAVTRVLQPRLPITYNETALSCLLGRPQVKTLNNVSVHLPLSSNEESPSELNSDEQESPIATDAEADSPCHIRDESPAGMPDQLNSQTRGEVTNESDVDVHLPNIDAKVPREDHPDQLPERATTSE